MTPLAPSFQLLFSLSPPVGGDPSETQTQGDLGGQGLRHGPSAAPQAAQAVREGPRSSGSHSRLARRCGAAHPAPPSTTGGRGARRRPRGRDPPSGRAPALSGPLASKFKLPAAGGSRGPGPPPRPQRGTASREAVREGSRSSGSHSRLARRCGAAHPASSSTTGGGGSAGAPAAGNHFRGTPPALTGPLAASQPAAVYFVGAPKPTSDPPGASRSGRHLELLFTGAAGSPYEGEPPAFHRFAPTNFFTGPRDTGAPCTAFFRSFGPQWLRADDGGVQSTLRVRPPS
ncbi:hypothetical protein NDU88_001399 [Pleurodeles waltl]|uniref:Uncharacterized protein n=1 Tax=Pleurodeles waltl TaxID=8319 RepID=A0AAV7VZT4_PLEWA|nr:hypothetical protein NDU88_001399 [Pleurodeles waltl]